MNRRKEYADDEKWRETCRKQKRKYYGKTAIYPRREWTAQEEDMLFDQGYSDHELSEKLHRSVHSIQIHRSRMRKKAVI